MLSKQNLRELRAIGAALLMTVLSGVMAFIVVAFLVAGLTGCATVEDKTGGAPYFDVGVNYQIDANSDWFVRTSRDWQCSKNWQAEFEVGLDWGDTSLGYNHQSWYFCGGPFAHGSPELYQDAVKLTHRFGGK